MRVPEDQRVPRAEAIRAGIGDRTLGGAIEYLVGHGFRVLSQADHAAQLIKPREFSLAWCILPSFLFPPFCLLYGLYYLSKRDQGIYLWEEEGILKSRAAGD